MTTTQPITLLICALGGEGGGVLSQWLVEAARAAGYAAQSTSIPGVAQRTGATTYYLELFPLPISQLGGQQPVLGLYPAPGALDALVSSELLETARQVSNGMSDAKRTLTITANNRSYTTQERMVGGDGRIDSAPLLALVRQHSREHHVMDMAEIANRNGTVVSAVMLGAIAGSGLWPLAREVFEGVVDGPSREASLRGFAQAFDLVQQQRAQGQLLQALLNTPDDESLQIQKQDRHYLQGLEANSSLDRLPASARHMATLGVQRLQDYQSTAYAQTYLERLQSVWQAEQAADPALAHHAQATLEIARWLALWMAFDDIVRVADLKSRASRLQRVASEVKAKPGELLHVFEHFKPGVPEIAALLPTGLARRLQAWDARRVARGLAPWSLPIKIGTHTVTGMLALRTLSAFKHLRPKGSRFAAEQALIEAWLGSVVQGLRENWQLGFELAQCGRLIKGYGSTNERGKENLLHITQHLATQNTPALQRAQAVAAARQAALQDEAGTALDAALRAHGAPARPIKAQPIRWFKHRPN